MLCICGKEFEQPSRAQGGGSYKKYCSSRCRSRNWASSNPIKVDTSRLKHAIKPESREKKAIRQKRARLTGYGLSPESLTLLLKRQDEKCQICRTSLDEVSAKIDHDHSTGVVRGLLCNRCNLALGQFEDAPTLLSNAIAYLDRNINKQYIYLVGSLRNKQVPIVANELRAKGFDVFDQWYGAGETADESWQAYSRQKGLSYQEALKDHGARTVFHFDRSRIEMSDIVILLMPAGKSGHLELGFASGRGKRTAILFSEEPDRYDVMPQFANLGVFFSLDKLVEVL